RDIGGLIVIDFIDMANRKHAQQVEEMLRDTCKPDKARVQFARISRFGLLEMSRQRLRPSIRESTTETCPRCLGRGRVRIIESMALQMLTRMEDHAEHGKKPILLVQVPKDTGEYLMNNKRNYINRIEENYEIQINLQIRPDLEIPHYRIERQWTDESQQRIEVLEDTMKGKKPARSGRKLKPSTPVVGVPTFDEEIPPEPEKKEGLLSKIGGLLFGSAVERRKAEAEQKAEEERKKKEEIAKEARNRSRRRGGRRRGGRGRRPGGNNSESTNASAQKTTSGPDDSEKKEASQQPSQRDKKQQDRPASKVATEKTTDKPNGGEQEQQKSDEQNSNPDEKKAAENGKPRRRRRRRRPNRPATGQADSNQADSSQADAKPAQDNSADNASAKPAASSEQSKAAPTQNTAPAATSGGE
ncbi:MAG: ribonuclease E/G, partial [Mariprofundaceae bacterium]